MNCDICDRQNAFRCYCGHFACEEHTMPVKLGNVIKYWCVDCYEEAKSDYESNMYEEHLRAERCKQEDK